MNHPALSAKEIFDHAHEIDSPDERKAYLERVCADAPDLRRKVETLLRAYDEAGSFLEKPIYPMQATGPYQPAEDPSPAIEGPETQIGPYRLIKQLGAGGMGAVYLAEQEKPIRRQVALKIIKPGMDSAQVLARFDAERQALTMMDHVNIARVFDAGTTDKGRPYFVMELVQGIPLTRFCSENTLTIRERLMLFTTVCSAIQHAHQKGVMHRDIKPSNVLVAVQDGKPMAKVIDFGLAKATEQPLTEHTALTQYGNIVGTLEYMSPEQADFTAQGMDTRTDIYSLGVVLYELLTGTTPLDPSRQRDVGLTEMLRRIREEDPPRPSARVAALGERGKAIATERKTDPARLAKVLRGELDWIVMKALEKDPARRYETASGLAKDVQHYLDDEPVEACPPSLRYQVGKFARKHWKLLATAGSFVALLMLLVIGLIAGIIVVNEARLQAEAAKNETGAALTMTDAVIQVVARNRPKLGPLEKTILRNLVHDYRRFLPEPGVSKEARAREAERHLRLANSYAFIFELADAEASYRRAIQLYETLAEDFPNATEFRNNLARSLFNLAILLHQLDKRPEAEEAYRQAIDLHEKLVADSPGDSGYLRDLADDYNNLGTLLRDSGELAKAEKCYRHAIALGEKLANEFPDHNINLGANYHNLGNAVRDQGNVKAALLWYGKAIKLLDPIKSSSGDVTLILRNAHWDRANALGQLVRHAEASQDWQQAIALDEGPAREHLRLFLAASQMEEKLKGQSKPAGQLLYQAAVIHAWARASAEATREPGLRDHHGKRALELLHQAKTVGWFRDPERIKQLTEDNAFGSLPSADFKRFLDSLQAGKGAEGRGDQK